MAATSFAADMVSLHVPVPVQPPPVQPMKVLPDVAAAVRVTRDPELNEAWQVEPQEIPDGTLVTVPEPVPVRVTVTG